MTNKQKDSDSRNEDNNNTEDFDNNLPQTVKLLRGEDGTKVYLVGTAHVSIESQNDVSRVIQAVQPNAVVVELCSARSSMLQADEKKIMEEVTQMNMDKLKKIIATNGVYSGLVQLMMWNMYANATKQLGVLPGGEFRRAYSEAKKMKSCEFILGDRPIHITIHRLIASMSWAEIGKICVAIIGSPKGELKQEDVENLKKPQEIEQITKVIGAVFPSFEKVLIRERNVYLTHSLQIAAIPDDDKGQLKPKKVVGVVGAAHVPGIQKLFPYPQQKYIPELLTIPSSSLSSKINKSFKMSLLTYGALLMYIYNKKTRK